MSEVMKRYIRIIKVVCITVLLLQTEVLSAALYRHLSVEEGLSSRQVYQVCKDTIGFVWAYTHIGVDRYDGNEIKHYRLESIVESKNHILSFTIMDVDTLGNLWIAQRDGQIYRYDVQHDNFYLQVDLGKHISQLTLNDMKFEEGKGLWLALSTGIYFWSYEENKILPAGLMGEWVNCFVKGKNGTFYAGTGTSVFELKKIGNTNQLQSTKIHIPIESRIESLFVHDGRLYIGTFSHGVYVKDLVSGKIQKLDKAMVGVPIRAFVHDGDHTILIGSDGGGVFCINEADGELIGHYSTNEDTGRGLEGNTVSDIHVDEYGGIWVSTTTNGLCYLDPNVADVQRVRHERNNAASLVSNHVNVLMQDSEGDYWYGTNNGISLYRTRTKRWTHFLNNEGQSAVVLALCEDADGTIWAGGYGLGLYNIRKQTGSVTKMPGWNQQTNSGVSTDYIYTICADGDNLWVGGIEGRMFKYNKRTRQYTYYPIDCLADIKKGDNGTLLLAACGGLGFLNTTTGEVEWKTTFNDVVLRYPIRCLMRSSIGELWLVTDGDGLIRYNPMTGESRAYTMKDGLVSNSVNSIVEDTHGHIWFNTEKELYCLDLAEDLVINGNELLDISWGYYNANAALRTKDGQLAFGTAEGILYFTPTFDFSQDVSAKLIFTDLKLPYESVKVGEPESPLQCAIDRTDKISLKYRQNSFSIAFSAINFISPHRLRYEYRLKNYEEQWHRVDEVETVSYMDIPSGNYLFELRAFDKYTHKQVGERALKIAIQSPFWASWWAVLIYVLLLVVLLRLLFLLHRQRLRGEKAKEKINSFIGIAHDIRTPVTLIKAPLSELEAQEDLPEEGKKKVAVAVRNVDRLFTMITQLMELEKMEVTNESLHIARYDIKAYLEEKMAEFRMAIMQKGVKMKLEVEEGMPDVWIDREKMDHIMDNLLSNALKYTEKGCITVKVSLHKNKWSVAVQDTGIGIPKEEQGSIFHEYFRARNTTGLQDSGTGIGLLITRRLVKQHHGDIFFNSVEGKGTAFVVTFPLRVKADVVVEKHEDEDELLESDVKKKRLKTRMKSDGENVLLLAEDDEEMREYLKNSLSSDYRVVAVADGGKALEVAREINPDIIISDVIMPVLEGDELCRMLKSSMETSHIPVVLLTALSERENIIFGLESGANDYIIKPFDLPVLKARLRNILSNRQRLREAMLLLNSKPEEAEYVSQLDKEFLEKVMEVVTQELANPDFSIGDFCDILAMSRTSVYTKLKALTGQGPKEYIHIVRLNKAKELLDSRMYTIAEISTMVGFSDPKYFSTCFKRHFGIAPSKVLNVEL